MRSLSELFLRHHRLENESEAFKDGLDCAIEMIETNLVRVSFKELQEVLRDSFERSKVNLQYAKSQDARDFQLGYQAVCKHFLAE